MQRLCSMGCESVSSTLGVIPDCVDWGPAGKFSRSTGGQWITALELFREMRQCPLVANGFGMMQIGAQA